jgi:hypothetical protein
MRFLTNENRPAGLCGPQGRIISLLFLTFEKPDPHFWESGFSHFWLFGLKKSQQKE